MIAALARVHLMQDRPNKKISARELRIGLAVSRYHEAVTSSMRNAAIEAFVNAGGQRSDLVILETPGSFELTAACRALAWSDDQHQSEARFDALVAIGCIITGATTHDQFLAHSVVQGLTLITVHTGVPI